MLIKASSEDIISVLQEVGGGPYRGERAIQKAEKIKEIICSKKFSKIDQHLESVAKIIKVLCERCQITLSQIEEVEKEIAEILPEDEPFSNQKGIDVVTSALLLEELAGKNFHRNENGFLAFCGLVPCQKQSGGSNSWGKRRRFNRKVKWIFRMIAATRVRCCQLSKAYFKKKLKEGKKKGQALISLARYIARNVFKILDKREFWNYQKNFTPEVLT